MKYRHAFHAGNFADVTKHVALVAALLRLTAKDTPLFYLETHAGRGRYDLADAGAEAQAGVGRLDDAAPAAPALRRYLEVVRQFAAGSGDGQRWYPGSPRLVAALMRPDDHAALCELEPAEAAALRREFRGDARFGVHCRDGYESLKALLPPRQNRGLVLIDPPYEGQERELEAVADALGAAAGRWPQGGLAAWYPIKLAAVTERFHRRLERSGLRRLLVVELCVHADDSRAGLNGSGLVFVNPPWQLDLDLGQALPELLSILAPDGGGRTRVSWLAGE